MSEFILNLFFEGQPIGKWTDLSLEEKGKFNLLILSFGH